MSMSQSSRFPAVVVYLLPFIGWLYVYLFQRQNPFALYHLKQAIGLFLFLLAALIGWAVIAWVLAWVPLLATLSIGLFMMVILAYAFGCIAWLIGLVHAYRYQMTPLPWVGKWADQLRL